MLIQKYCKKKKARKYVTLIREKIVAGKNKHFCEFLQEIFEIFFLSTKTIWVKK